MSHENSGATAAPADDLEQAVDRVVSSLVAAEYDDGVHPVVANAIDDLRYALNFYRINVIRAEAGEANSWTIWSDEEHLFWSNSFGWTGFNEADWWKYEPTNMVNLPIGGRWVSRHEACRLSRSVAAAEGGAQ